MSLVRRITPAQLWRAFFVSCLLAGSLHAAAPAKPPELAQVGLPDAAETSRLLEQFRQSGIPGQYFWRFELHALPRRGDEVVYQGRLWGARNEQGAITRVELTDAAGKTRRLLVQNGERPALWRFDGAGVKQLGAGEAFEPLIPGVEITAFDLQMPFLYWPGAKVESLARTRGRPANVFLFPAPPTLASANPDLRAVRAYLDTQANAILQLDYFGPSGLLKSFALVDLKKVGEQWLPRSLDWKNEITRDKTRFVLTGVALNLQLPPAVFAPASLAEPVASPTALVTLEP